LVRAEEFQGKIAAAVATRTDKDLIIVARTEALIAGLGEAEALRRAAAYEEAGADMILVHSKQKRRTKSRASCGRGREGAIVIVRRLIRR